MANLGRLNKVDLRTVWASESTDFTPWLAREENLSLLSDAIGILLELEAIEKNAGPFRADLLCKDTAADDDSWVLIENQLEKTDHRHLGQLLTYAAGLKAVTIVWVADRFTEEHRAALDWLNDITDKRFNFFALEVELWRIGNSDIAPKFNIISKPNDWSRSVVSAAHAVEDASLTETRLLQQEFWQALSQNLLNRNSVVKPQTPGPRGWTHFALGKTNVHLACSMNTNDEIVRVSVNCKGPHAIAYFQLLSQQKVRIETEFGRPLDWLELPDVNESRIELSRDQFVLSNRDHWQRHCDWIAENLQNLFNTFSERAKKLDPSGIEHGD